MTSTEKSRIDLPSAARTLGFIAVAYLAVLGVWYAAASPLPETVQRRGETEPTGGALVRAALSSLTLLVMYLFSLFIRTTAWMRTFYFTYSVGASLAVLSFGLGNVLRRPEEGADAWSWWLGHLTIFHPSIHLAAAAAVLLTWLAHRLAPRLFGAADPKRGGGGEPEGRVEFEVPDLKQVSGQHQTTYRFGLGLLLVLVGGLCLVASPVYLVLVAQLVQFNRAMVRPSMVLTDRLLSVRIGRMEAMTIHRGDIAEVDVLRQPPPLFLGEGIIGYPKDPYPAGSAFVLGNNPTVDCLLRDGTRTCVSFGRREDAEEVAARLGKVPLHPSDDETAP